MKGNSNRYFGEYERRLSDNLKLFIDFLINGSIDSEDFNYAFKDDSSFTIKIAKYF